MKNKFKVIFIVASFLLISFTISYFINSDDISGIISSLPSIIGIILAGVLASITIIFGLLNVNELAEIYEINNKIKNGRKYDFFKEFLKSIRLDTRIIFFSFFLILLISLVDTAEMQKFYEITRFDLSIIPEFVLLGIAIFFILLSISSAYDIIMCIFILYNHRYERSIYHKEKIKE
ncbi:MAG: hypothetical protein QCI00_07900 [Candidatus Thermoplasmatota archaeon]|nr:hypothetical protein [Candidatus Thermoplasmatota archaeon]